MEIAALTPAECEALLWLPADLNTHLYGVYPHTGRPVAADSLERADVLFDLSMRFHALADCACVDRPGTGEAWRDRRWVLTREGFEARTKLEAGHA